MTNRYGNYGYSVISANADRSPDKLAVRYRGRDYTFDEINRRVNRTANALLELGVRPGDRVAVLLDDVIAIVDTYLALAKVGATLVALNPYWTEEVLSGVLAHCQVAFVYVSENEKARVKASIPQARPQPDIILSGDVALAPGELSLPAALASAPDSEPPLGAADDDPAAFFFTSGTTGLPKPVVHSHSSCRSMAEIWLALPRSASSMWGTGPIIWGIGFPCTIGAALYVGMPVVLEDDFGPEGFLGAMRHSPVSHMTVIPSFWSELLSMPEADEIDLSCLQAVVIGGEPLGSNLLNAIKSRAPGAQIFSFYGQTEAPYTCFGRLDDDSQAANAVGTPRPTCAAQVLDPNGRRVVNEVGELAVNGPHRMAEYYGLPDKTADAIREGWFFSGDMAIQDAQGCITVLGRKEDAIHRQGKFVQPLTVEDAAMGLPGVIEAGAVGVETGQGDTKILLAVRCVDQQTEESLRSALADVLAPEAVPDCVVVAAELPHGNDNSGGKGKLLRGEIRRLYQERLLEQATEEGW